MTQMCISLSPFHREKEWYSIVNIVKLQYFYIVPNTSSNIMVVI